MNDSLKKPEAMPPVACDGATWGRCAALGWALRRASEAEERLRIFSRENLLASTTFPAELALNTDPVTLRPRREAPTPPRGLRLHGALGGGHIGDPPPPTPEAAQQCPNCMDTRHTTRGLSLTSTRAGWVVCAQCYTRWRTR